MNGILKKVQVSVEDAENEGKTISPLPQNVNSGKTFIFSILHPIITNLTDIFLRVLFCIFIPTRSLGRYAPYF